MVDTTKRDQDDIIHYLETYGVLTISIALYQLAFILPLSFERAMRGLMEAGTVVESIQPGRRPVYYLANAAHLQGLFPVS